MNSVQAGLVADVLARLGPKSVTIDRDDIAPWEQDWRGKYCGHAPAMLLPATRDEAAAMVAMARAAGVALVPQGGNTSMVGGATPPVDGSALLLATRRMAAIRSLDAAAGTVVAEAGVILAHLHESAAANRMRFPLTLGARGSATVGGLVSTNAGGTQVLRWGTMRNLVLGVEAVLPDGSVYDGLAPLKKNSCGYDLNHLLIGAEGTLGLITAATLRLVPEITSRAVAWVGLDSPHAAFDLLNRLQAVTSAIESFEILSEESMRLVLLHIPNTRAPLADPHRWHVLIEAVATDATDEPPAELLERLLAASLEDGSIADAVVSTSEGQAEAFWKIRDSLSEAERAAGPAAQHDISVPVADMPDFMIDASRAVEARFPGTIATAFGHLGDGNVHFHVRAPGGMTRVEWEAGDAPAATRMVNDLVIAAGGSISAEHGIGQMKFAELARLAPPARLAALRAIRDAFDPARLFNPGKLVA